MKMAAFQVEIPMPDNLEKEVSALVLKTATQVLDNIQSKTVSPGWYRKEGAALYAGVSTSTIAEWVKKGLMVHPVSTGIVLFSKEDIDEFIRSHL